MISLLLLLSPLIVAAGFVPNPAKKATVRVYASIAPPDSNDPPPVDLERARWCAGKYGVCSKDEIKSLRNGMAFFQHISKSKQCHSHSSLYMSLALHQDRMKHLLVEGTMHNQVQLVDRNSLAMEEKRLEDDLSMQLKFMEAEPLFVEAAKPFPNSEPSKKVDTAIHPERINQILLEDAAWCLVIALALVLPHHWL